MDGLSVREYAQAAGISPQRARALTGSGRIPASRIGTQWVVHPRALYATPRIARPLSTRNAWLVAAIADRDPFEPSPTAKESYRARQKLTALADSPAPGLLASSWLAARAQPVYVRTLDIDALVRSPGVRVSGLSDHRSPLQSAREADVYISASAWVPLRRSQALVEVPMESANAVVRIVDDDILLPVRIPLLMVAADVFDHGGPREQAAANSLVATALRTWQSDAHG